MARIRRLSEELINQIAAGEVVERPASVVKELAENALDAGATSVHVELRGGGIELVAVSDDGHGMGPDDARASLERHATSKLADASGLWRILTKGFRGEGLSAIASVSRLSLRTSERGALEGTHLALEGGVLVAEGPCAPPDGTRVEVADLFFNTPARRKFLKRTATEVLHCEDAVHRLALAHPEVSFTLEHDGRRLFGVPRLGAVAAELPREAWLRERLAAVLGGEAAPHLLAVEERCLGVAVTGFVASPEYTLPNARGLWTFVNRRYVRDRGLNAAVQRAFRDALPMGRQPVAVVFVELPPEAVDVNVHPQKLEVRFVDPRSVCDAVGAAVSRALAGAPWQEAVAGAAGGDATARYALAVDRFLSRVEPGAGGLAFVPEAEASVGVGRAAGFGTARPGVNEAPPPGYFAALRLVGELAGRFWVCEGRGGSLVLVDPRAAVERVTLQALLDGLEARRRAPPMEPRPASLFSSVVTLPRGPRERLLAAVSVLAALGIEFEPFGGDGVLLRCLPPALGDVTPEALLRALAEGLMEAPSGEGPVAAVAVAGLAAQAASAGAVRRLDARAVLGRLEGCDFSVPCGRARVVVHEVPLLALEERAGGRAEGRAEGELAGAPVTAGAAA